MTVRTQALSTPIEFRQPHFLGALAHLHLVVAVLGYAVGGSAPGSAGRLPAQARSGSCNRAGQHPR